MFKSFNIGSGYDLSRSEWEKDGDEGNFTKEDSEFIGTSISPDAYRKLLILPQTLKFLLLAIDQPFCHTPVYCFNSSSLSFEKLEDKAKRKKYEIYFQDVKKMLALNHQIQQSHINGELPSTHSYLINICILINKSKEVQKTDGYNVYFKHELENPETLGVGCIVVYYHESLKKCVIIGTSSKCFLTWNLTTNHIISTSVKLPFHKDCSFCGRCAEDLTKCTNCKVARYCNKTCQVRDWDNHKLVCKQRKEKLSEHTSTKSKLRLLPNHPFIIWKMNVESAKARRIDGMQQAGHHFQVIEVLEDNESQAAVMQVSRAMSMVELGNVPAMQGTGKVDKQDHCFPSP